MGIIECQIIIFNVSERAIDSNVYVSCAHLHNAG
jgi:hypothetical protein